MTTTHNFGGHQVEPLPGEWRCLDCGLTGGALMFTVGTNGCPMRPASLDYLSVCPGGDRCQTHPNTNTAEWRAYRESSSSPLSAVPRITCDADLLGARAAGQWLRYADKIGLKMSVWSGPEGRHIGAQGGTVAELTHQGQPYHVTVTIYGNLAAHEGNDWSCQACDDLKQKGQIEA